MGKKSSVGIRLTLAFFKDPQNLAIGSSVDPLLDAGIASKASWRKPDNPKCLLWLCVSGSRKGISAAPTGPFPRQVSRWHSALANIEQKEIPFPPKGVSERG